MKWSVSGHNAFRRSQRQYLFGFIAAAAARAKDPVRHEAYILKQLQSVEMWQGDLVHDAIRHFVIPALSKKEPLVPERIISDTLAMKRGQFDFSREQRYRIQGMTKKSAGIHYAALHPHEYGAEISDAQLQEVETTVVVSLNNLFGLTNLLAEIRQSRSVHCEEVFRFNLDDVTVTPQLDLLYLDKVGLPTIIDWKISDSDSSDYAPQLMVYALALKNWRKDFRPEDFTVFEVNLLRNYVTQYPITAERLDETEDFIFRSVTKIRSLVGDNKWESQEFEEFEPAKSFRTCQYCNFRKLCQEVYRDLPSSESVPDPEPDPTQLQLSLF